MNVRPVIVAQVVNLFEFLMMGEVNDIGAGEADVVLVLDVEDLLLVVHDEERLSHLFLQVVLYVLSVGLESHEPAPRKLKDLLDDNIVVFVRMELDLFDLLSVARALREENGLIVSAHHVISEHGLRLADDFEV